MKKFDNYVSHLRVLQRAPQQDRENEFIDQEVWLSMLRERNNTSHIYDGEAAKKLVDRVIEEFIPEFIKVEKGIEKWYGMNLESSI